VNKKPKILFFCMIVVGSAAFSQKSPVAKDGYLLLQQYKTTVWQTFLSNQKLLPSNKVAQALPPDFYAKRLGFFCRQEIKLEKAIKIPFRFRLGSVEQCNWLERKKR